MNIDQVKSAYQKAGKALKSAEQIEMMTKVNQHPSLRGMRRQLIIEILLWTLFLVVYYDFFDGHLKPMPLNVLLIASVFLLLVHNVLGYVATQNPIAGENITQSLENYLQKIKRYSLVSILTRALAILSIMLFFISTITFDARKYWIVSGLGLVILFQIFLLHRVWANRIRRIQCTLEEFST